MANHHHHHHRKPVVSPELALASDLFDKFCGATTLKTILSHYRSLCEILHIKPTNFPQFYPKLKSKLCSWRAQALWNKFDKRANHKCYNRGKACPNTRVLIIGAGPCGLRAAIEAQLLGAKVVVVEKRDRISRNNVLHLWPFVIQDLRSLGAKKFFGKFCAGSIDHISIRQLQCILLKVALLLGVEIYEGISFEGLVPPTANQDEEKIGWRAKISPEDHPVSQYEFDVLIGADGKRNTLEGFKRKEFRGKLAIAITANFINHHTEAEARVEEISGVAYIFNQKFFKDLRSATGIDLENIVYYKDDTHYFVMTAKKHSLLNKRVILNDYADTAKLLAVENINKDALMEYAREAADFSTGYKLPQLQFAVNHYGQPDVAMFDFTSMYAAENASRVIQEKGYKLLMCLVGDSLLEPFWPTGSGCARGFLSSMDACWALRSWGSSSGVNPLDVLAERESIYRLLNQTTPENLSRDISNYMLDPHTRYPNLNTRSVLPIQVKGLYSTDDPVAIEQCLKTPSSLVCDYSKKRRRKDTQIHHDILLSWLKRQVALYSNILIEDTSKSFKDGLALCAIIHRYRPDLIDFNSLESADCSGNNQLAFDILEKEYGILPVMTGTEMEKCDVPDNLTMLSYLTQVYDIFRGEIPYTHHKEMDDNDMLNGETPTNLNQVSVYKHSLNKMTPSQKLSLLSRLSGSIPRKRYRESRSPTITNRNNDVQVPRKSKKRKSGSSAGLIDRDPKELQGFKRNPMEENFSGRVKDIETKLKEGNKLEKKPKDLLRAIGKIEKTDWNIKEIEKKIEENKYGRGVQSSAAKVPKWNRQQFDDKFTAVKKKLIDKEVPGDNKYAVVDNTLRRLEQKLKNGTALEQGQRGANKVSAMAAQLTILNQQPEEKLSSVKSGAKNIMIINSQGGSEMCHFCNKRVYLMERLSAEGRFFHRGCFRCEYCGISLRLGNYTFDRDGKYGSRFYCTQHFGCPGVHRTKLKNNRFNDYKNEVNVDGNKEMDILPKTPTQLNIKFSNDSTDTPERVGFENLEIAQEDTGSISINEMDEDEWTDHNFGTSANELASSDDISDISESEEDDNEENEFAQALDIPSLDNNESLEFTRRFSAASLPSPRLDNVQNKNSRSLILNDINCKLNSNVDNDTDSSCSEEESPDHISYHEFESEDESDTATGNKERKLKDLRLKEVHLKIPEQQVPTDSGSETEVASDEYSISSGNGDEYDEEEDDDDEEEEDDDDDDDDDDSATEISTDSEFERNHSTVIKSEIPDIVISESLPTRRGHLEEVKTIQVISKNIPEKSVVHLKEAVEVEASPSLEKLVDNETKTNRLPFMNPHRGNYFLNRTQSTEGVASKISLELKKKYLLGDTCGNLVKKSDSTSVLDTKFKSLVDQISEHQKLLNPAPEHSQTMQTFLECSDKLRNSAVSPTTSSINLRKSKELVGIEDFPHVCNLSNNFESLNATEKNKSTVSCASHTETDTSHTTTTGKTMIERPSSPIYETSILVPELPKPDRTEINTVSTATATSASEASSAGEFEEDNENSYQKNANAQISLPKVEIHNSRGELLPQDIELEDKNNICNHSRTHSSSYNNDNNENNNNVTYNEDVNDNIDDSLTFASITDVCMLAGHGNDDKRSLDSSLNKIMAMPLSDHHSKDCDAQILKHVSTPAELFISSDLKTSEHKSSFSDKSSPSTPTSLQGDDNTLAVFTETELSDWARDEDCAVSENFDDMILGTPNITYRRHQKPKKRPSRNGEAKTMKSEEMKDSYVHVCGKTDKMKPPSFALANIDDMDIEFMDTGEDDMANENSETVNPVFMKNRGYIEYVTSEDEAKTPLAEAINANYVSFVDYTVAGTAAAAGNETLINGSPDTRNLFTYPQRNDDHVMADENENMNTVIPQCVRSASAADDFDNFVHRLHNRITPFGNVKDSIDIRKARKSPKSPTSFVLESHAVEQIEKLPEAIHDGASQKLEQLSRERSKQRNLIHEMVMSKLQSEGKNIQDRKAKRQSRNSLSPFNLSLQNSLQNQGTEKEMKKEDVKNDDSVSNKENVENPRVQNVYTSLETKPYSLRTIAVDNKNAESFSLPDIRKALNEAGDKALVMETPSAVRLEVLKSTESIRQQARTRARLMSDSELGLSPEDKLKLLKQKIAARKAVQSAYVDYPKDENYMNDRTYTNSVLDVLNNAICEAEWESNSKDTTSPSPRNKLVKDKDRKKSIIQAVSDFFSKKSPIKAVSPKDSTTSASNSRPKFKISLMGKEKAKSKNQPDDSAAQLNYVSESDLKRKSTENSVPPRPPSPLSYTPTLEKSDENLSVTTFGSRDDNSTLSTSKQLRSSHRKTRRENQKRLRMAQEIQRQLEEIEVKQKELEFKGVNVEKALRNKNQNTESEFELMQELLDMIRERNELRKYEQKLLLKAKEIESEDPYLR